MALTFQSKVRLNSVVEIPILGLGLWQIRDGGPARRAVTYAIECGYRLFDTARLYGNERDVGLAIRESGVPREDLFVTTKLWNSDHGYDETIRAFERSLQELALDYVDLYLIHWPVPGKRKQTWKAMESLLGAGKCRAIGVSNYMISHLEELLETASILPAVNQVEFNAFLYQKELLEFCRNHGVLVEAYSPLTKGHRLDDRRLALVAAKYRRTPAQVLLRWCLQHDLVPIPKSSRRERIVENSRVFDFALSPEDMAALDTLDERLHTGWDPSNAP